MKSSSWKHGANAALMGEIRKIGQKDVPDTMMREWFAGFDEARRRLAGLEGELVRGEAPILPGSEPRDAVHAA